MTSPSAPEALPPLRNGERLDQKTFHERYEAMPSQPSAELVDGVVYMPSPLKTQHGSSDPLLKTWLTLYMASTPGTGVVGDATTILGDQSEPQPDASLRILTEFGGQTRVDEDDYLRGAPELISEIAYSSEAFDLGPKLLDYQQTGVREYLVILLKRQQVRWFALREGSFQDLALSSDGFFHSEVFPGLWLDPQALLRNDVHRLIEVLNRGLASPEHAQFVASLRRP
jgi:hypothetical protein